MLFFALILPSMAFCDTDGRLARCAPYRAAVVKILKENGLSERFYYLMVAESGCRAPGVTSKKGAVGFWQMTPATARAHGCHELQDLDCATRAAASYLKDLSTRFEGNDIIAAWNQGGHNLKKHGMTPEARGLIRRVRYLEGIDKGG
jgi:soluble lytic murein transglycosylase-like protein